MPRPRKGRRCLGPYGRGPYAVVIFDGEGGRDDREFATEKAAEAHIRLVEESWGQLDERSISDALDAFDEHLKGVNLDGSRVERMRRLRLFFASVASIQLTRLRPSRGQELYDAFRVDRSVDYHRNTLGNARGFLKWCKKQGWISDNPLVDVEGVEERSVGKEELSGDEAQRFFRWCTWKAHRRADGHQRRDSDAAIGVMLALTLGLRSGDVTKRLVRDVDLDGTVLRVGMTTERARKGKTKKSNRARRVPEQLQPLLRQVVEGAGRLSRCSQRWRVGTTRRHGSSPR
jgi:integrase